MAYSTNNAPRAAQAPAGPGRGGLDVVQQRHPRAQRRRLLGAGQPAAAAANHDQVIVVGVARVVCVDVEGHGGAGGGGGQRRRARREGALGPSDGVVAAAEEAAVDRDKGRGAVLGGARVLGVALAVLPDPDLVRGCVRVYSK